MNLSVYENDEKLLEAKNVHADESGLIKIKLEWNEINPKLPSRSVYAVVTDKNGEVLYDGAKMAKGPLIIIKKSDLLGLAEYHSAVRVGTAELTPKKEEKNDVCPRCEILTADEVSKIFTNASVSDKEILRKAFNNANTKLGLNTCQQKAHFFCSSYGRSRIKYKNK